MECDFCGEFRGHCRTWNRLAYNGPDWVVLPGKGAFLQGYTLLMPDYHYLTFASIPKELLTKGIELVEVLREYLSQVYAPTIIAEHGPGSSGERGASCCEHAHLHFFPIRQHEAVVAEYIKTGGQPIRVQSPLEIQQAIGDRPYVYLSPKPGEHLVWDAEPFCQQFARRVCANLIERGDEFDWREHLFEENMHTTYDSLQALFSSTAGKMLKVSLPEFVHNSR